jgi:hypothetical protein
MAIIIKRMENNEFLISEKRFAPNRNYIMMEHNIKARKKPKTNSNGQEIVELYYKVVC